MFSSRSLSLLTLSVSLLASVATSGSQAPPSAPGPFDEPDWVVALDGFHSIQVDDVETVTIAVAGELDRMPDLQSSDLRVYLTSDVPGGATAFDYELQVGAYLPVTYALILDPMEIPVAETLSWCEPDGDLCWTEARITITALDGPGTVFLDPVFTAAGFEDEAAFLLEWR